MKEILFIRHGSLKSKFADYSKLAFADVESLLTKSIDPSVDQNVTLEKIKKIVFLQDYEGIISSKQKRSVQTAKLIKETYGKKVLFSTELLDQVNFFK